MKVRILLTWRWLCFGFWMQISPDKAARFVIDYGKALQALELKKDTQYTDLIQ